MSLIAKMGTEEKILTTARFIFHRSGFHGARMQEIADKAGINKALLHYYFRSKDKLFHEIIKNDLSGLIANNLNYLEGDVPFEKKLKTFIANYIQNLIENPHLPAFVIHEINHNTERLVEIFKSSAKTLPSKFIEQIKKEIKLGNIKKIKPEHILMNIISLSVFPFMAKPIFSTMLDLDDKAYTKIMIERKHIVFESILNGIRQ